MMYLILDGEGYHWVKWYENGSTSASVCAHYDEKCNKGCICK